MKPALRAMNLLAAIFPPVAALALAGGLAASCASTAAAPPSNDRICTPGNFVVCLCADAVTQGTKLCHTDGKSFGTCLLANEKPCPAGELVDAGAAVDGGFNLADKCTGVSVAVDANKDKTLEGDTTPAVDDYEGKAGACAVGKQSPDDVYELLPTASGPLTATVKGAGGFDPTIYLRASCADTASQLACSETTGPNGTETVSTNVITAQKYYLVVDGKTGSKGKYSLTLSLKSGTFCGDGKVQAGEACDDGNKTADDGCSNDCQSFTGDPPSMNGCPGHPVDVWPGKVVTGTGSNTAGANTFTNGDGTCTKAGNNGAPEHVYAVTAHKNGTMVVTLTGASFTSGHPMILVRRTCTDPNSWEEPPVNTCSQPGDPIRMCANCNGVGPPSDEKAAFPVVDGTTYTVAASGALLGKGTYTLSFEIK